MDKDKHLKASSTGGKSKNTKVINEIPNLRSLTNDNGWDTDEL